MGGCRDNLDPPHTTGDLPEQSQVHGAPKEQPVQEQKGTSFLEAPGASPVPTRSDPPCGTGTVSLLFSLSHNGLLLFPNHPDKPNFSSRTNRIVIVSVSISLLSKCYQVTA